MARFEGALARACAGAGLVPPSAAEAIAAVCGHVRFDSRALALSARQAGTLAIPFVKLLTAEVAKQSSDAARHVHFGATSQDVIDTAVVLCVKDSAHYLMPLATRFGDALAALVARHRETPLAARTLLQPALPMPFGWKAASWLSMLSRSLAEFRMSAQEAGVLQFGGAAGTLSAYGARGSQVASALAKELGLRAPAISWHSARDRFARVGAASALLTAAAARVARDVSLMMQPEIGEAVEPAVSGRGGSSSLPHKRNPAGCLLALEAAQRAPGLVATLFNQLVPEHERGLGQWQGQWFILRGLLGGAASALAAMAEVCEGLELHPEAMQRNLAASWSLVYSEAVAVRLSGALGKAQAHALMEKLCLEAVRSRQDLRDILSADELVMRSISKEELAELFRPQSSFGAASAMMDGVLEEWSRARVG